MDTASGVSNARSAEPPNARPNRPKPGAGSLDCSSDSLASASCGARRSPPWSVVGDSRCPPDSHPPLAVAGSAALLGLIRCASACMFRAAPSAATLPARPGPCASAVLLGSARSRRAAIRPIPSAWRACAHGSASESPRASGAWGPPLAALAWGTRPGRRAAAPFPLPVVRPRARPPPAAGARTFPRAPASAAASARGQRGAGAARSSFCCALCGAPLRGLPQQRAFIWFACRLQGSVVPGVLGAARPARSSLRWRRPWPAGAGGRRACPHLHRARQAAARKAAPWSQGPKVKGRCAAPRAGAGVRRAAGFAVSSPARPA